VVGFQEFSGGAFTHFHRIRTSHCKMFVKHVNDYILGKIAGDASTFPSTTSLLVFNRRLWMNFAELMQLERPTKRHQDRPQNSIYRRVLMTTAGQRRVEVYYTIIYYTTG